jgi:asparagine synthase (glutamine-hydrolysing)
MCGIVGLIHLDGRPSTEVEDGRFLKAAAQALAHRGPDDERFLFRDSVGFGFRRLSIVDLAGGDQPFQNEDGTVIAMTNGEIYNHALLRDRLGGRHAFSSRSDCEVVVHLFEELGPAYVTDVNGIFGTAIYDRRTQKVHLVRDRLGVKPLFYFQNERLVLFASEIKALLVHPEVPRRLAWQEALTIYDAMLSPTAAQLPSFFQGIRQLPAGSRLEIDIGQGRVEEHVYWDPRKNAPDIRSEDPVRLYRRHLERAVGMQLMSDVEYGLFLSGGIDSVSIARLASKAGSFHTFTVLSQSTFGNGDAESAHAAARAFDLPNHQVLFDFRSLDLTPAVWKRILWMCEMPLCGAEMLYKYLLHAFAKQLRPGLKVMLLGQGSDEFNGGYARLWAESLDNWGGFMAEADRRVRRVAGFRVEPPLHYEALGDPPRNPFRRAFLSDLGGGPPYDHLFDYYRDAHRTSLQIYNLWHEDRTAAAHGIESRVPFLDHELVELTYAIPPEQHQEMFWDKAILRQAMEGLVPEPLRLRKKVPFFDGDDVRYTRRLLYRLLRADSDALVEEAIAGAPDAIDADAFRAAVREVESDPEYTAVDRLIEIANMGLLSQMARDAASFVPPPPGPVPVTEVHIGDWEAERPRLALSLVTRAAAVTLDTVIRFTDGVLLTRCEGGDPQATDPGAHYILVANQLTYILEPDLADWVRFLRAVDGKRTLAEILGICALDQAAIWKHLEEAIEHRVLMVG